jgi:hypothetical protein
MSSRKGWQLPTFAGSGLVQCMCTHLANPYVATWLDLQCCICLGDFEDGEQLRVLGCKHGFHMDCVDEWLPVRPPSLALCVLSHRFRALAACQPVSSTPHGGIGWGLFVLPFFVEAHQVHLTPSQSLSVNMCVRNCVCPLQRNRTCPLCKGDLHVMQAERRDALARGDKDPLAFGPDVKLLQAPTPRHGAASGVYSVVLLRCSSIDV